MYKNSNKLGIQNSQPSSNGRTHNMITTRNRASSNKAATEEKLLKKAVRYVSGEEPSTPTTATTTPKSTPRSSRASSAPTDCGCISRIGLKKIALESKCSTSRGVKANVLQNTRCLVKDKTNIWYNNQASSEFAEKCKCMGYTIKKKTSKDTLCEYYRKFRFNPNRFTKISKEFLELLRKHDQKRFEMFPYCGLPLACNIKKRKRPTGECTCGIMPKRTSQSDGGKNKVRGSKGEEGLKQIWKNPNDLSKSDTSLNRKLQGEGEDGGLTAEQLAFLREKYGDRTMESLLELAKLEFGDGADGANGGLTPEQLAFLREKYGDHTMESLLELAKLEFGDGANGGLTEDQLALLREKYGDHTMESFLELAKLEFGTGKDNEGRFVLIFNAINFYPLDLLF